MPEVKLQTRCGCTKLQYIPNHADGGLIQRIEIPMYTPPKFTLNPGSNEDVSGFIEIRMFQYNGVRDVNGLLVYDEVKAPKEEAIHPMDREALKRSLLLQHHLRRCKEISTQLEKDANHIQNMITFIEALHAPRK